MGRPVQWQTAWAQQQLATLSGPTLDETLKLIDPVKPADAATCPNRRGGRQPVMIHVSKGKTNPAWLELRTPPNCRSTCGAEMELKPSPGVRYA